MTSRSPRETALRPAGLAALVLVSLLSVTGTAQAREEQLRWRAPTNARIDGYRIHLGFSSRNYETELRREVRGKSPDGTGVVTVHLHDLDPDVDYYVAVSAFNEWGSSGFSNEKILPAQNAGCSVDADCPAAGPCSVGVCDGTSGCGTATLPDGSACDDGDPATVGDVCLAGACAGQSSGNGGCSRDSDCSDGMQCNGAERCQGSRCVSGAPLSCPAPTQCTIGVCVEGRGCESAPALDGLSCNDGDSRTSGDACRGGVCVGLQPEPQPGDPDEAVSTVLSALGVVARSIASSAEGDGALASEAEEVADAPPLGIDFGAEFGIFTLASPYEACGPDFCILGDVQTDGRGRLTGSASLQLAGGTLQAILKGNLKGKNGATQVKLDQRVNGTLNGLRIRASSKLQGEIDGESGLFDLEVKSSACVRGARCRREQFRDAVALDPAVGAWTLDLDFDDTGGKRAKGSAVARLGDGSLVSYVVQGTYQPKQDQWNLRLRSLDRKSTIGLRGVVIDEGLLRGGSISYRIMGHSGKGVLEP